MTTAADGFVWRPTPEVAERSRIARFMRAHGIGTLAELQRRSVADLEWYWDAVVRDLGVRWTAPYTRVLDDSSGVAWPTWFPGGRLNLTDNCVDRHVDAGRGAKPAIVWEGDDGHSRTLTYAELAAEVNRLANALRALGVGEGDRVGIFLPMSPEAAIATLAVVKIGAIYTPCFSGFGAGAVASRLSDCEAKLLITADGFHRRGQIVKMKETADEAVAQCPSVRTVLVYRRLGREIPWTTRRDHWWHEAIAGQSDRATALAVEADRPCLIIYTSGTTGRPKGAVLTHGGFLIKTAHDFAYCMDVGEGDRLFWLTDLGWLMGPMAITAALFHGGTAVVFEGVPDYPEPDRLWSLVERHRISVMGTLAHGGARAHAPRPRARCTPTICRRSASSAPPASRGIRSPTAGSSRTRARRGSRSSTTPAAPRSPAASSAASPSRRIKPCAFTGPIPGMAAECFGDDGRARCAGTVGELVITRPWPGMTAGFWRDPARYEETYWSRWPDVWVHGDWAYVDADGFWFIQGRSDDTLKIAGKRLGPAEVESVLVGHPAVAEAGVIGVPHADQGRGRRLLRRASSRERAVRGAPRRSCPSAWPGAWARRSSPRRSCSRATCPRPAAPRSCAA